MKKFEVGQTAYVEVEIVNACSEPIFSTEAKIKGTEQYLWFTKDGKSLITSEQITLHHPEEIQQQERVIEVNICGNWERRVMFATDRWGYPACYVNAKTIEDVEKHKEDGITGWSQWRELNPQRESDLSRKAELEKELDEINKRLG